MMKVLFEIDKETNGVGSVIFSWQHSGNYLATAGSNRRIHIFDRQGKLFHQISLSHSGPVLSLEWDKEDEVLAILQNGNSVVSLWYFNTNKLEELPTNMKDLCFMKWSSTGPQLAIGNVKGSLLLYNRRTLKKIPIKGKHTKKIVCGCWNSENKLALGSTDLHITISDVNGDSLEQKPLKLEPLQMDFYAAKLDQTSKDSTLSINLGKSLLLYETTLEDDDSRKTREVLFNSRHGDIIKYTWFGDGYIMVGFSTGFVGIISTHKDEIEDMICSGSLFKELYDCIYNEQLKKGAFIGDHSVKVVDLSDLSSFDKCTQVEIESFYGIPEKIGWTQDGQILTVSTKDGHLFSYLTSIPLMNDAMDSRVIYLSSLSELCIKDVRTDKVLDKFNVQVEPSFVSLGIDKAAVGMNNRVWFYKLDNPPKLIGDYEYLGTVEYVKLSKFYAGIFYGGRATLQWIEEGESDKKIHFPEKENDTSITSIAITDEFFIYSTMKGNLFIFSLSDWTIVTDFRYKVGISKIFPNYLGTRIAFIDETHEAMLYNPVDDTILQIEQISGSADLILWDNIYNNTFIVVDEKSVITFVYSPFTRFGSIVEPIKMEQSNLVLKTTIPEGRRPILLMDGMLIFQLENGKLISQPLETHIHINGKGRNIHPEKSFQQYLNLTRFEDAWNMIARLNFNEYYLKEFAKKAIDHLNFEMAIRAYRKMGDAAMVMELQRLSQLDEKDLILGNVALLLKQFTEAEFQFMKSSNKVMALEMRRDLMHWDHALKLAEQLDPNQIPIIALEYAQQLEIQGEYLKSKEMFEKALNHHEQLSIKHRKDCECGIARTTIRLGDTRIGFQMAFNSDNRKMCIECASILEELSQFNEAAQLYEKAELYEKAVDVYLRIKNFSKAEPLMSKVSNPKLFILFAKAKEREKKFKDAMNAYEKAGDFDSVVRILLNEFKDVIKAVKIVRETKSPYAADLIAKHCKNIGDYKTAVQFLMMAEKYDEALGLATTFDQMDTFAEGLGDGGTIEQYLSIVKYYESKNIFDKAGDYYVLLEQYDKALSYYLKCGESQIDKAIKLVAIANRDELTHQLADYLMGEVDGVAKDSKYIVKLYKELGNYRQTMSTAVMIAQQEQMAGNYVGAHEMLFETYKAMRDLQVQISSDLRRDLLLLHSYLIVKDLTKLKGQHEFSARMLIRVSRNISKFPQHVVPILTSTVILCAKANLNASALEFATMLARPEYIKLIDGKYKTFITKIIRKRSRNKSEVDKEEELTKCPYCHFLIHATCLECSNCKKNLPYCIATGRHMTLDDWSECPHCKFPASYKYFQMVLKVNGSVCPMCNENVDPMEVKKILDPRPLLKKLE